MPDRTISMQCEIDWAESPGLRELREQLSEQPPDIELTINGIRMLVRRPAREVLAVTAVTRDGTANVTFEVLDVLSPPEARLAWLEAQQHGADAPGLEGER